MRIESLPVPFVPRWRIVVMSDEGDGVTAVVESLVDTSDDIELWLPQMVFEVSGPTETFGLACALTASIRNGVDLDAAVRSLTNRPQDAPGGRYVVTVSHLDGDHLATLEERVGGRLEIVGQWSGNQTFYEAYGRAMSEMIPRGRSRRN